MTVKRRSFLAFTFITKFYFFLVVDAVLPNCNMELLALPQTPLATLLKLDCEQDSVLNCANL